MWTGIGAAGAFGAGLLSFYGDAARAVRRVSVRSIVAGIVGLKRADGPG